MPLILSIPMPARLAMLFVLGSCVGSIVNWAIYGLAWYARPISPWSRPDPAAPRRQAWDRVPILGWLGLRREAALHGPGFWIRPMTLEILAGVGFAALYWWEIGRLGLLPRGWLVPPVPPVIFGMLHCQYAAHVLLISLMLAASMIDVDEKTIPDEITVAGTLLGLLAAAAWPESLLPDIRLNGLFLHLASPNDWPEWLAGAPRVGALALGLGCWWAWCAAILPRTWHARHGFRRAVLLCCARIAREPSSRRIARMALVGALAVALVWFRGGTGWQGLLSALVGMAASGGLVWAVRVVGSAALGREALGFGDVTLMAMIGAFLGWQPCLVVFFLAPFAGLAVGVLRLLLFRDREIPYGPFRCLAALTLIVFWNAIWGKVLAYFEVGWLVPLTLAACLALLAAMLVAWRLILAALRR